MRPHGVDGDLRFNQRGFIRAHCDIHSNESCSCRRQRQTTAGRLGAGRPIGSLVQWLKDSHKRDTQQGHILEPHGRHSDRKAARNWFKSLPDSESFLSFERPQTDLEADEEPMNLP